MVWKQIRPMCHIESGSDDHKMQFAFYTYVIVMLCVFKVSNMLAKWKHGYLVPETKPEKDS